MRLGARRDGQIVAIDLHTLSNAGAYGYHAPTTVGLSGHKTLPLYNHALASRFAYDVVYTNTEPAGAFRGYGATQGCFAVESADALEPTLRAAMDVDGPAVVAIPVDYSDNPLLMGQLHLSQIL